MGEMARKGGMARRRYGAIYFSHNSASIGRRFLRLIKVHARYMSLHPLLLAAVVGHRDASESLTRPALLGRTRATAVRDGLAKLGVRRSRMTLASFGARMPRLAERSAAAQAANRRVDIIYFGATEAGGSPPIEKKRSRRTLR